MNIFKKSQGLNCELNKWLPVIYMRFLSKYYNTNPFNTFHLFLFL